MDVSQLDTFTFNINKSGPKQAAVVFQCAVSAGAQGDLESIWQARKADILAAPELAGFTLDPASDDATLSLKQRRIQANLRFTKA